MKKSRWVRIASIVMLLALMASVTARSGGNGSG